MSDAQYITEDDSIHTCILLHVLHLKETIDFERMLKHALLILGGGGDGYYCHHQHRNHHLPSSPCSLLEVSDAQYITEDDSIHTCILLHVLHLKETIDFERMLKHALLILGGGGDGYHCHHQHRNHHLPSSPCSLLEVSDAQYITEDDSIHTCILVFF